MVRASDPLRAIQTPTATRQRNSVAQIRIPVFGVGNQSRTIVNTHPNLLKGLCIKRKQGGGCLTNTTPNTTPKTHPNTTPRLSPCFLCSFLGCHLVRIRGDANSWQIQTICIKAGVHALLSSGGGKKGSRFASLICIAYRFFFGGAFADLIVLKHPLKA